MNFQLFETLGSINMSVVYCTNRVSSTCNLHKMTVIKKFSIFDQEQLNVVSSFYRTVVQQKEKHMSLVLDCDVIFHESVCKVRGF